MPLAAWLWLCVGASPAQAGSYTSLDGVLAEARALQQEQGAPVAVGLPGSTLQREWTELDHPGEEERIAPLIAPDGLALQRALLHRGWQCGLSVTTIGRRGYRAETVCAAPMNVVIIFPDGQRLHGRAEPLPPPADALLLRLPQAAVPMHVPLDAIREVAPWTSP